MTRSRFRLYLLALVLLALLAGIRFYRPLREWLAIDTCLDNGGRWDYVHQVCDHGP
jgi:hypothetical protein